MTIEQVAKKTKLSVGTVRVYTSQKALGKKIGSKRVYSEADVAKLLKGSGKPTPKKKGKAPVKKTAKKVVKRAKTVQAAKPKPIVSTPSAAPVKAEKTSFWSRLFLGKKPEKVSLTGSRVTK
jgi:hypothetical protein